MRRAFKRLNILQTITNILTPSWCQRPEYEQYEKMQDSVEYKQSPAPALRSEVKDFQIPILRGVRTVEYGTETKIRSESKKSVALKSPPILIDDTTDIMTSKQDLNSTKKGDRENEMCNLPSLPEASVVETNETETVCPQRSANIFSRLSLWWMTNLIVTGFRRTYTDNDVWELDKDRRSEYLYGRFYTQWEQEMKKWKRSRKQNPRKKSAATLTNTYQPSVTKSFLRVYGWQLLRSVSFNIIYRALDFAIILLQMFMIRLVYERRDDARWGYTYVCVMLVVKFIQSLLYHHSILEADTIGMCVKSAVLGSVYRKMLVLGVCGRRKFTAGQLVNILAADTFSIMKFLHVSGISFSLPFIILGSLIFLYQLFGVSTIAGLGVVIVSVILNFLISRQQKKLKVKEMTQKDQRLKILNQTLNGIKVLKLYAWEESFIDAISKWRKVELLLLLKRLLLQSLLTYVSYFTPALVSLVTFSVYVVAGNELSPEKAFTGLALIKLIEFVFRFTPICINCLMNASVALKRITDFLIEDELLSDTVEQIKMVSEYAVEIEGGSYAWKKNREPVLINVNLRIPKGDLVAVVGSVGCGKSSLIAALLGEINVLSGRVGLNGKIAYVAQVPWIQNKTLKDNILFNKAYDKEKYDTLLQACALDDDINALPRRDLTEIGEKGVNLSGGQKQRVSIARAAYSDSDIYLLDDSLSAVDSHVGNHIFNCVIGNHGILREKTRLLVTHNISYLSQVDQVVVLKDGRICEIGSYDNLVAANGCLTDFLKTYSTIAEKSNNNLMESSVSKVIPLRIDRDYHTLNKVFERKHSNSKTCDLGGDLIKNETSEVGHVRWNVFLTYLQSMGVVTFLSALFFCISSEAVGVGTGFWLVLWSTKKNVTEQQSYMFIGVYGALGGAQACLLLIYAVILSLGIVFASKSLHQRLVEVIIYCPMAFFESNPLGRIMNRFSKDINAIDNEIQNNADGVLTLAIQIGGVIFVILYSTPLFIAVLVPIAVLYFLAQQLFIASVRQLNRMEAVRRSPVLNHFLESIHGATTIRAFSTQQEFILENARRVDHNLAAYFVQMALTRWLNIRLDFCGNMIVFFGALFCILRRDTISAGVAGLSLIYASQITRLFQMVVYLASELEVNFISVERTKNYLELQQDDKWEGNNADMEASTSYCNELSFENLVERNWPSHGILSFQNYSAKYGDGFDLALDTISFTTKAQEKVGVVGRTGAGKSSIANALFRIINASSGAISIDGIDITTLKLKELRSKLSIIPQDPVLFPGTIRFNLDPTFIKSDSEIWSALEDSHLKDFFATRDEGISFLIEDGGSNLSIGQRQLLCLARALLRKSKILVLDEATSGVDMATDSLIQETIRVQFKDSTVLTIAHRLNTIMEYDRILVLDKGTIAQFDTPQNLVSLQNGLFYKMVLNAGILSPNEDRYEENLILSS